MRLFVENALSPDPPDGARGRDRRVSDREPSGRRGLVRAGERGRGARRDGRGSATIRAPTLVIHGTADNVVDAGNAPLIANAIAGARLELFEGVGHLLPWERPEDSPRWSRSSSRERAHDRPLDSQHGAAHAAARRDRLPRARGHVRRARPPLGRARRRASRARASARRPRRHAHGQLARARDRLLRLREGRPHPAAAELAARGAGAPLPARRRRAVACSSSRPEYEALAEATAHDFEPLAPPDGDGAPASAEVDGDDACS